MSERERERKRGERERELSLPTPHLCAFRVLCCVTDTVHS